MADTFSLRFEIDASRAEAGARQFIKAIDGVNKSLSGLDAKAEAAFSKLMAGGASGGDFTKLAKDLGKLNNININPAAVKSINSIGNAFKNLKAPSPAALKNINSFATSIPALLNSFNVSGSFAESVNKISSALAGFKVPSESKIVALKAFGMSLQEVAPSLRIAGNFAGITKLGDALGGFRAPSEKAVSNMKAFFSALNNSGSKASVSGSLVSGIINLSNAVAGMKAPSSTSVKNLRDLFSTLATFKPVSGTSSISAITQAFSNFKGPTPAQIKNVEAFVKMLGNLKVPANAPQIAAYLEKIGIAAGTANKFLNNFRTNLNGIGGGGFTREAAGMTSNLRGLENAFSGTFQAASVFRTLIGSITLGTLSKSIYDVNNSFNAFKSTLLAVNEGNLAATGEEMRYTEDMAKRLGQRIDDIQESFGSFSVSSKLAGVSTDQTREIFEATITAMTVLHRSSDRTKLALLALEQMMSKGTVSSEELRRQLGEQLPGAVNLAARALGVNTAELQKMLKAGSIASNEFLPKFAAEIQKTYGGSLQYALKGSVAQFNLLYDALYDLQVIIGQSGAMDALAGAFQKIREAISAPEFLKFASEFGERTAKVVGALGDGFVFLVKNIDSVVLGLKLILTYNIASYLQGMLGSLTKLSGAWSTTINVVSLFGQVLTGARPALQAFGLALEAVFSGATLLSVATGPIGLLIIALGVLGTTWYATRQAADDFSVTLDGSKDALGRYKDLIATFTTAQLIKEQGSLNEQLDKTNAHLKELQQSFVDTVQAALDNGSWSLIKTETQTLAESLLPVIEKIQKTGGSWSELANIIRSQKLDTPGGQAFAKTLIEIVSQMDTTGQNAEVLKAKIAELLATLNGGNASGFVSTMNAASGAATDMAAVVSKAADDVEKAYYKMSLSKNQAALADNYMELDRLTADKLKDATSSSTGQDQDKMIGRINNQAAIARSNLDKLADKMTVVKKLAEDRDKAQNVYEKYGDGASEAARALAKLHEQQELIKKNTKGRSADEIFNAMAGVQQEYNKKIAEINKGNKPKKDHTGGAASAYLDDAAKSTLNYNKAQETLERQLKKGQITQAEYNDGIAKLKAQYADGTAGANAFTSDFEKLRSELMPSTTALDEFTKKKQILDQEFANTGNLQEYTDLLTRLKKQYSEAASGGSPWIAGINKGLTDLTKTSEDFTNDVAGAVSNAFNGLEDALTEWVTTGKMDFKSLATSILGDIARIVIRYTVIQPIIQALSGLFGGMFGGGSSSFGGFNLGGGMSAISTPMTYAKGGAFNSGNVIPFANGGLTNGSNNGIVTSPTLFDMSGSKTGLMGEAGPEAIIPLKRAADGSLGVQASGAVQASSSSVYVQPKVNISIINNGTNASASTSTKQNPDGSLDVNVLLEQIKDGVAKDISKGGTNLNKAIEARYGSSAAAGNKR
jgi:lambda family phage tail tape measure protein